ncbi:MAG TPA: hypothetical protein VFF65_03905, partial [Phycisphaerales bacterium]|nr:hypothetical protein [Phycisphaerales bacterium]
ASSEREGFVNWMRLLFSQPDARTIPHRQAADGLALRLGVKPAIAERSHAQGSPGPIYTHFRLHNAAGLQRRKIQVLLRNGDAAVTFNDSVALTLYWQDCDPNAAVEQILATINRIRADEVVVLTRGYSSHEPYGRSPSCECLSLQSARDAARHHCTQKLVFETPFATLTSWTGNSDEHFDSSCV